MISGTAHAMMKPSRPHWMTAWSMNIVILVIFGFMLTACTSTESTPEATKSPTEREPSSQATGVPQEETKPPEDPNVIQRAWESSSHSDSFVVSKAGTNSTCARCHAPVNWIPTMDDMPETCLVCKFEVDPPPPLIPEAEWTHVECIVCHKVKKDEVQAEYAWLEIAPIEEYAEVASVTELCDKCHLGDGIPEHAPVIVGRAHQSYECTECHNAHDTLATCSTSGCHADVPPSTPGHDEDHASVACVACHDASGMEIGLVEETGTWFTFFVFDVAGERSKPFASHNTALEAPCDRCHYPENPWGLIESVSTE
ncbi:MAG: hypothetical protein ACFE9C_15835 [Candidatus Hodarchaeota archaeon]